MTWYAYEILPIDYGWDLLPTLDEFSQLLASRTAAGLTGPIPSRADEEYPVTQFFNDFKHARDLATRAGWEGDFGTDPHVFMIPGEGAFRYAFAWKQSNNGTTFVMSETALPWLDTGYGNVIVD
jgi:hypothetical protein